MKFRSPFLALMVTLAVAPSVATAQDGNPAPAPNQENEHTVEPDPPAATDADETPAADEPETGETELDVTVVTASRTGAAITELPSSVTVVDREQIEKQSAISRDLGDILAKTVPGLGTSTESLSNFGQPLRGRNFLVLIDGVPQSTPLRNVFRDLRVIDPQAIERIEVIRGGTAVYGFGAEGGLINLVTRKPDREEGVRGYSEAGLRFSTEHPDESLQWHTTHGASGRVENFDFLVSGSFNQRNLFFDADGEAIPPDPQGQGGIADSDEWDALGKFGFETGPHRFELTVNHYQLYQETDRVTQAGAVNPDRKAIAVPGDPAGLDPGTENTVVNVGYTHYDLWGSQVSVQAYYQDYYSRFGFSTFFPGGGQSFLESQKIGTRLTIDTPFDFDRFGGKVVWGLDFQNDTTEQPLEDGRVWVPEIDQNAIAGFAQLELPLLDDRVLIRAGVRHEAIWLDVDDFTVIAGGNAGNNVEGGELDYSETLFNAGAVIELIEPIDLFGGFSQGFSVADVGRELRGTAASSVEQLDPEAKEVDSYEIGLRGDWESVQASVAGFFSESDLGTSFSGSQFQIQRLPEEVWGIEATLDVQPHEKWTVGGTFTWTEGHQDADNDGSFETYLDGTRIPPIKITGYVEHQTLEWWSNRLQVLYSGERDRFEGSASFAQGDVDDFIIVDYFAALDLGPGQVKVGVENLLNEDYFTVISQVYNLGSTLAKGQGRTVSLAYNVRW